MNRKSKRAHLEGVGQLFTHFRCQLVRLWIEWRRIVLLGEQDGRFQARQVFHGLGGLGLARKHLSRLLHFQPRLCLQPRDWLSSNLVQACPLPASPEAGKCGGGKSEAALIRTPVRKQWPPGGSWHPYNERT